MTGHERVGNSRRDRSRWGLIAFVWLLTLFMAGCVSPPQPSSPLPPGIDLRLVTNVWKIVEVVHQDEMLPLDGVPHLRFRFHWGGAVFFQSGCHHNVRRMDFTDSRHYRLDFLALPTIPAMECFDPLDRAQYDAVLNALHATNEISFQDDRLWLTGDDTRIVLASVEGYPAFPATQQNLILNRWRWVEASDRTGSLELANLPPIYTHYWITGLFVVLGDDEGSRVTLSLSLPVIMLSSDVYVLTSSGYFPEIGDNRAALMLRPVLALLATHRYEVHENRLLLTGDGGVRIVMEIDNPSHGD